MASARTGKKEIRDVCAGDEEHDADRAEHDEHRRPHIPDDLFSQQLHVRAHRRIRRRIERGESPRDDGEVRLGALRRHAALEPPNGDHAASSAQLEIALVRIISDRQPHIGCPERSLEARTHDADDSEWLAVQDKGAADDVGPRAEAGTPDRVIDNGDRLLGGDLGL